MTPKISILTASIGRQTLKILHESLITQIFKSWEWIIVLDGEKSRNYFNKNKCQSILENDTGRIRLFVYTGKHHAFGREQRRKAFELSKGQYIIYIDDDDYFVKDCLLTTSIYINQGYDLILWKVRADWLNRIVPTFTKNIYQIGCGDICSNGYAVKRSIVEKVPYPITSKRDIRPGVAVDFYWFDKIRKQAKKPILLDKILSVATHDYPSRGKEPKWVSKFGH